MPLITSGRRFLTGQNWTASALLSGTGLASVRSLQNMSVFAKLPGLGNANVSGNINVKGVPVVTPVNFNLTLDGSGHAFAGQTVGTVSATDVFATIFNSVLSLNDTTYAGFTLRQITPINAGAITQAQVLFKAASSSAMQLDHASIGVSAGAGNTVATPVELTFNGGQSGFSISAGATILSDPVHFVGFTSANNLVVIMDFTAVTGGAPAMQGGISGSPVGYYHAGASYNSAAVPSGSIANPVGDVSGVVSVQVMDTVHLFNFASGDGAGYFAIDNTGTITVTTTGGTYPGGITQQTYNTTVTAQNTAGLSVAANVNIAAATASNTAWSISSILAGVGSLSAAYTGLPSGVVLQAIDGETMLTSTTMSNNFFARNGYTIVSTGRYAGATSWDDINFFPIVLYYGLGNVSTNADVATFVDLGFNITINTLGDPSPSINWTVIQNNNLWVIDGWLDTSPTAAQPGFSIDDQENPQTVINGTSVSSQTGRPWVLDTDWNGPANGYPNGNPTDMITALHSSTAFTMSNGAHTGLGVAFLDMYWFAGVTGQFQPGQAWSTYNGWTIPITGTATADQMKRGSNYGTFLDYLRACGNGQATDSAGPGMLTQNGQTPSRIPLWGCYENYNGNVSGSTTPATPEEVNWAQWSTLIHGARGMSVFYTLGVYNTPTDPRYISAKAANTTMRAMAPIINSPFARGYVTSISNNKGLGAGYIFPTPVDWPVTGVEAMAKYVTNGGGTYGNGFYIFATMRASETVTATLATFHINHPGATLATVLGESRTIAISGGQFIDTFANAWTVHVYKIS